MLQASQLVRPANSALTGRVSRVSTSTTNSFHPNSFLWTINQINEFVSVDSLIEIFVQHNNVAESDLLSKSDSAVEHVAFH